LFSIGVGLRQFLIENTQRTLEVKGVFLKAREKITYGIEKLINMNAYYVIAYKYVKTKSSQILKKL
jgi:hypothetical protein